MPRQKSAGLLDVASAQRLQDHAMILAGPRPPAGIARHREHQARIRQLQPVEAGKQARHRARRHQRVMKGAIGHLEFLDRLEERLTDVGATVRRYRKPTFAKPAPVDLRHEIATQCQVVIEALAD